MENKRAVLLAAGFMLLSINFTYDLPGTMASGLTFGPGTMETRNSFLYSICAAPNIIFPCFFSYVSRCSRHALLLILAFMVLIGQLIFTIGVYLKNFSIMIAGRAIFGIGCESYSVVQSRITLNQFKRADLSKVRSFYNSCGKIGTIMTFIITPIVTAHLGAAFASLVSCLFVFLGVYLSYYKFRCHRKAMLSMSMFSKEQTTVLEVDNDGGDSGKAQEFKCTKDENKHINANFKLLLGICFALGMVLSPFYNIAPMMYQNRFKMNTNASNQTISIIELISLLGTIILGPFITKFGHKLNIVILGCFFLLMAHLNIIYDTMSPYRSVIILGIASPMISLYWDFLPKFVSDHYMALAIAILCCTNNVAIMVSPLFVAFLSNKDASYLLVECYLFCLSFGVFLILLRLLYTNNIKNLQLNAPEPE